jgi:hypothetical protein
MELTRRVILVLAIAVVAAVTVLPCFAAEKKAKENIWTEGEQRGPGPGPRPGPGRGPGRGPRRIELTDEEIDRIMKGLQESNPEKAKELAKLRETDPNQFSFELRRHGRESEEFDKIIKERMAKLWSERREKFLEWLRKAVPSEAQELAKLKDSNPDLYTKKYELAWRKYGRIYEEGRRNPELAEILIEDLELKKRRDELVKNIKAAQSEIDKKKFVADLEKVVADRFDLIVRRKQIAYGWLIKRLEELRKRIKESRGEIARWRDEKFKNDNVKKRMQDLLEENPKFNWD